MFFLKILCVLNKTLNHCFVLRMRRKAVGPMYCVTHVKEPSDLIEKRTGGPVFLAVAAECPIAPCKPRIHDFNNRSFCKKYTKHVDQLDMCAILLKGTLFV